MNFFFFLQLSAYLLHLYKCLCFHGFIVVQVCAWCSRCCWLPCSAARGVGVLCTGEKLLTHGTHNVGLWKIHLSTPTAWRTVRDLHISYINTQETYVRRHMWTQEDTHLAFTSTCKGNAFQRGCVMKSLCKSLNHSSWENKLKIIKS